MRLRWKITMLVFLITLGAAGTGAGLCARQMQRMALRSMAESEGEKLAAIGNAFRQVGTREDFEQMGELARDAYLRYQFEQCYPEGYGLIKDGACIANRTAYEILNPQALTGAYMVQELDGRQVFLFKQPLAYPEGFEVLAARDISPLWDSLARQTGLFLALAAGIGAAAAAGAAFLAGRMLKGLEYLKDGAEAIGRGELGCRIPDGGKDEIGVVSRAFNRMSDQVERQIEDLHLLLGALAHEMKTPVTAILGYGESLRSLRLTEEQKRNCAEQICRAGARMEKMSGKLMRLIGLYENDAIEMRNIPVRALLERVKEACAGMALEKELHLEMRCSGELYVNGDEELLTSLLCNLVQNGCRASRRQGEIVLSGKVRQPEGKDGESLALEVLDYGCGIAPEDLPNITKAFYMGDKSRSRSEGGAGLGLALAERIAALHGARLEFTSRVGEGTRAQVVFPVFFEETADAFTKDLQGDEDFAEGN